jgi:hypothetical protein
MDMRQRTFILLASIGVAAGTACGSSSNSGTPDSGSNAASSGGSSGSSSGAGSSSGGGSSGMGLPMGMQIGTAPTPIDGGVYCGAAFGGMGGACASPQVCCWGDQSQMPAPIAGCTDSNACTGSSIGCSATAQCSAGQVCCFVYGADAGTSAQGIGTNFTSQCATDCPEGDMVHYRLCGSSADCAAGDTCNMMAPYSPYCSSTGGRDGGGGNGGNGDGGDAGSASGAADAGPG